MSNLDPIGPAETARIHISPVGHKLGMPGSLVYMDEIIKNDKQMRFTEKWIKQFQRAHRQSKKRITKKSDMIQRIATADLKYMAERLQKEVADYKKLKKMKKPDLRITDLDDIGRMLIRARIVRGISEKELGQMINHTEKEIQKFEAFDYQDMPLHRIQEIYDILSGKIK